LAVGLWLVNRELGVIATILALTEGFSSVYLGRHYPHDVAAAGALSVLVVLGGWPLVRHPLDRLLATLETTPLRPIPTAAPWPPKPDPEASL
jgi:membrane-associated phospholipid phosphatase